jgi:hypothetical protein
VKSLFKAIDDRLFAQVYRRTKINARRLARVDGAGRARRQLVALKRERSVRADGFLYSPEVPRFIGGTTGRSGTRWLVRLLKEQFVSRPVVMDEIGVFVLAALREAPYEYYQFGADDAAERRAAYLDYFLRQMRTYAFRRRRIYGAGMRGLIEYVPGRAIHMAGEALAADLPGLGSFEEITRRFGDFYQHLLNYHAALIHGAPSGWISKEPPYGRHADELLALVPNGRLVVLARDGRASALSMYRRRWMDSVRGCMERWGTFAEMTLRALEKAPADQVLLLRYEDMVRDFETNLSRIHKFFELPAPAFDRIYAAPPEAGLVPNPESLDRWKSAVDPSDVRWFAERYGETMERLG